MTTIVIFRANGQYKGFTCMGHAGFKRAGKDIVCASISVLVINTINAIAELAQEDIRVESDQRDGFIECRFPDTINEKTVLLMDAMVLGLKEIKKNYGNSKKSFLKDKTYFELMFKEV